MNEKGSNITLNEQNESLSTQEQAWKVMIVDDDVDIHDVTKFVLRNFEFKKKKLQFFSAYSIDEAKKIMKDNPDMALILLDIVMEEQDSGLKFVKYLREELQNHIVRIILRTGYPGLSPEIKVVIDYDINDYKEKTELTKEKFFSAIIMALRSFEMLSSLQIYIDNLKSSSEAAERFIFKDYLKILKKESIADVKLGDHAKKEMVVLFMDMSRLISLNGQLSPDKELELINSYVKNLDPIITEQQGFIDTFMGDCMMALFYGPPDNAVKASIDIIKKMATLKKTIQPPGMVRIGVQTGLLTLGIVGNEKRMDYSALGETVHVAAQLEICNRHYNTSILVGEDVIKKLIKPDQFHFRWITDYSTKENQKHMRVYEIFDVDPDEIIKLKEETKSLFESAVKNYVDKHHEEATKQFFKVLQVNPQDEIVKLYLDILES